MPEKSKERESWRFDAKDAAILLALLLVAIMALWPVLCAAPAQAPGMPGEDGRTQWYPWRAFAADSIRHGTLPLWNPYILCGAPFLGNFQSALFYPPNFIFLIAPIGVAARASVLFHIWLSMIFAYLLARMFVGRAGAAVGALAFGLCAAQILRVPAGHWGVSCAIPWLPLIFLCAEWTMRRPNRAALLVGAFAVAMQVLSGMPQYVFITAIATGLYALIRPLGPGGEPWKGRAARWGMVAGMWLLGSALAAVQLLPGIEAAANGARSLPMAPGWLTAFSLGPECLVTMIVPGLFGGGPDGGAYWGRWLFWEMNGYVGVAALVLAAYALISERPRRAVVCFAVVACAALLLALGKHTELTGLLARMPLGGMFRGPAKFLLPFSLAVSMLAAIGADRLLSAPPKMLRFILCAAVAAAIALAVLISAPSAISSWVAAVQKSGECLAAVKPADASVFPAIRDALRALLLLAALVGGYALFRRNPQGPERESKGRPAAAFMIFFVVAADGVLFSRSFIGAETTFRAEGTAWAAGAGAALREAGGDRRVWAIGIPEMDDAMIERVPAVEGIEPNPPARFNELFQAAEGKPPDVAPSVYQLLSPGGPLPLRTALGRVLAPEGTLPPSSRASVLWRGSRWEILEVPSSATRALVVYVGLVAHSPRQALRTALATDPRSAVVLEEECKLPGMPAAGAKTSARIVEDAPDRVAVAVELKKPGWLVLLDNDFPGWKAEADGAPARILRADYAFRAVVLPAGSHRVVFRYRPASFYWGIGASLAALAAAVGIAVTRLRKRAKV